MATLTKSPITNLASASVFVAADTVDPSPSLAVGVVSKVLTASGSAGSMPGPPSPITTLPRSLAMYLAVLGLRVSWNIKRKTRRVPIAGSGSKRSEAKDRWWANSVRVQSRHV
jgi:hypothetical protein